MSFILIVFVYFFISKYVWFVRYCWVFVLSFWFGIWMRKKNLKCIIIRMEKVYVRVFYIWDDRVIYYFKWGESERVVIFYFVRNLVYVGLL